MPAKHSRLINSVRSLVAITILGTIPGCATERLTNNYELGQLGRFEYRAPKPGMGGVVVGAPHGGTAPATATLARLISERTGAGFVAAYGFKSKQITVEHPVVRSNPHQPAVRELNGRQSVFAEFKQFVRRITDGTVALYVTIRPRPAGAGADRLEVVTSGFTLEEAEIIRLSYLAARDRVIGPSSIEKLPISLDPFEVIDGWAPGILHHGVLMLAERGLALRVPEKFLSGANLSVYREIFSAWVEDIKRVLYDKSLLVPKVEVTVMDLGRFDLVPSRKGIAGVAIGAPHGSYDEYTAEIVEQLGFRTGLATVIARGFTPTEADGWRINVNRPSEKNYLAPEFEINSPRSRKIFDAFKEIVFDAAGGDLRLYFDVHQYGYDKTIQIATVGIDTRQALRIKQAYQRIRDRLLNETAGIDRVDMLIEPVDQIEIGAWPAKYRGILSVARQSLHIELPLHSALRSRESRHLYISVIAELVEYVQKELAQ